MFQLRCPIQQNSSDCTFESSMKTSYDALMKYFHGSWVQSLSPAPVIVSMDAYDCMLSIQKSIHIAMRVALRLWWSGNSTIRNTLAIPAKIVRVLDSVSFCHEIDESLGFYRPDLLFDELGVFRVCEINARFTLNGYILSLYLSRAARDGAFAGLMGNEGVITANAATLSLPEVLAKRLLGPDYKSLTEPIVFVVSDREPGHDILWLQQVLREEHEAATVCAIRSNDLCLSLDGQMLMVRTSFGELQTVRCCVLELHQDELLALDENILMSLMKLSMEGRCLNPLWTIFLLHDKRLLSLLPRLHNCSATSHKHHLRHHHHHHHGASPACAQLNQRHRNLPQDLSKWV